MIMAAWLQVYAILGCTDIGTAYSTGGLLGYAVTAPLSGLSKIGNFGYGVGAGAVQQWKSDLNAGNSKVAASGGSSRLGKDLGMGTAIPKLSAFTAERLARTKKIEAVKQDFVRTW